MSATETPGLVKQYSRKRFNQKQFDWIGQSMQRQIIAKKEGVPCPGLLSFQGKVLRTLPDGTVYMVMEFCPGVMLDHNTVTMDQMYSLGKACGQIHRTFSALPPQACGAILWTGKLLCASCGSITGRRWRNVRRRRKRAAMQAHRIFQIHRRDYPRKFLRNPSRNISRKYSRNYSVRWSRSGEFWNSFR